MVKISQKIPLKRKSLSVGTKMILIFFAVALLITIIFSFMDYQRKLNRQLYELSNRLDQIQGGFTYSLSNSLWKIDDEQTKIILESILRQKDIQLVKVTHRGEEILSLGEPVDEDYAIKRTYPLTINFAAKTEYIGDLEITATDRHMRSLMSEELLGYIQVEFLKVIVFIIFSVLFLKLIITRHIETITEFFRKNNIYESQKKLILNREYELWKGNSEDDLDELVYSINSMVEKLHEELQVRKKTEKELTQINESLEKRVEEKTKQLLESDRIEAVVEMSAGVAHEVNSPLSVVYGLNRRINKMIKKGDVDIDALKKVSVMLESSVKRIFSITNALYMLSDVTNSNSQRQVHLEKMIDESMKGIVEVFKSSVGRIDYLYHQLPKSILISKTMFYQLLYILVYLRAKAMESQNEHSWIRIEFSQADNQILITCYDNGAKLEGEERGALLDPFKSIALRDRGSLLMLGTFASLVNKLGAKLNFVDSNKSIFVQVRIPYGEDL